MEGWEDQIILVPRNDAHKRPYAVARTSVRCGGEAWRWLAVASTAGAGRPLRVLCCCRWMEGADAAVHPPIHRIHSPSHVSYAGLTTCTGPTLPGPKPAPSRTTGGRTA